MNGLKIFLVFLIMYLGLVIFTLWQVSMNGPTEDISVPCKDGDGSTILGSECVKSVAVDGNRLVGMLLLITIPLWLFILVELIIMDDKEDDL